MRLISSIILTFAALGGSLLTAAPSLGYVYNTASYIPPGLPAYGIPQGSFFVLYGSGMGTAALNSATILPLPTTAGLGGTTVTVTVNGTALTAPLWYTSSGQVGGVVPSATPVGTGTITLTYNGASGSLPITVIPSGFGIFTLNQQGFGPAVISFADFTAVKTTKSAAQGQTLILWGTGLGATTASDSGAPLQVNLNAPIAVYVGGIAVTPIYGGRSAFPGVDQINFTVPLGLSGCNVSLIVQTTTSSGAVLSNSTTIPVTSKGGDTCSDTNASLSQTQLATFAGKSSVNIGYLQLKQSNSGILTNGQLFVNSTVKTQAQFLQLTAPQIPLLAAALFTPSLGSCVTSITTGANAGQGAGITGTISPLDAGTFLTLTPPSGGPQMLGADSNKQYSGLLAAVVPGTYGISGTGGVNIAAFNTSFTVPQQVTWTNETSLGPVVGANAFGPTINRNQPLTITWTGGDTNGFVGIVIDGGFTGVALPVDVSAICTAPASAGSFTIPTSVLMIFPNTQSLSGYGSITVGSSSNAQLIAVPGTDATLAASQTSSNIGVIFQ